MITRTQDSRFDVPLYSISEVAWHLRMSNETLRRWVRRGDLVTKLRPERPRSAELPFMAFVEAQFYVNLRAEGLSPSAIVSGMSEARKVLGRDFLRRGRLAHNGRDILVDLADQDARAEWIRARDHQGGLKEVIELGLSPIVWGSDDLPASMRLTSYDIPVSVDPRFGFGQPMLEDYGVRVEDVWGLVAAGETTSVIAHELAIPEEAVASIAATHQLAA